MKKKRLIIRIVILALLAGAIGYTLFVNLTKDDVEKMEVGKEAPDFVLQDLNGEKLQLSDYKGKGILLNFWATWCKPCEREMPIMNNQYENFQKDNVEIITVNIGESDVVVKRFVDRFGLKFPVLMDNNQDVLTAYGVNPLPVTFLIDKEGIVKRVHTGEILNDDDLISMMEEIKP